MLNKKYELIMTIIKIKYHTITLANETTIITVTSSVLCNDKGYCSSNSSYILWPYKSSIRKKNFKQTKNNNCSKLILFIY